MTFEEIQIETANGIESHILLKMENGEMRGFPADEANPEYVTWAVAEGLMEAPVEPEVTEELAAEREAVA